MLVPAQNLTSLALAFKFGGDFGNLPRRVIEFQ
jgi:hypothetical protein